MNKSSKKLFSPLKLIRQRQQQNQIFYKRMFLNCQHFTLENTSWIFPQILSFHLEAGRENFPLFSFEHFRFCRNHLHFCCHSDIVKFIYISWTTVVNHKNGPSFRITSQLNGSDDLHSHFPSSAASFGLKITSRKLVYVGTGEDKKRFCKYCSRFCFRILRISSLIPDWTVINLNSKFSIRHTSMVGADMSLGECWGCEKIWET